MRESALERKLKMAVEQAGGKCLKFNSPGMRGVPDRICLFPYMVAFVEMKAPGEPLRPLQEKCKRDFERLGFQVWVIDSENGIKEFMDVMSKEVMPK
ncbi:MAG TPA: VRR-NUC domain-containing protein [Candidatus Binatia bacterium]|nr:VRR-NUC domain-containing protein [Candidatus Binatia bacterium]